MSIPRPHFAPSESFLPSRRGYRALVVALAAFLAMITILRQPFRGYLTEVALTGHAGEELDLAAARRWLAGSAEGLSVQIVTSPIYPGDCEIKLQKLAQHSARGQDELHELARQFIEQYLPARLAAERHALLSRLQSELQAARDGEDAQRTRVEELRGRHLASLAQRAAESAPGHTASSDPNQADLRERLIELRRELSRLLAKFTDEHPQVVTIRGQIARLEAELAQPSAQINSPAEIRKLTLVSTTSLLPQRDEVDLADEIERAWLYVAAATRNRQWAERNLQTALEKNDAKESLLAWSAAPARIVARVGGTPTPLSLLAAGLVALLAGGSMFHLSGRIARRPLIGSPDELASLLPVPLVGQAAAERWPLVHRWRQLLPHLVATGTLTAELAIVGVAGICLVSVIADHTLLPQLAADPLGALSELVGRATG